MMVLSKKDARAYLMLKIAHARYATSPQLLEENQLQKIRTLAEHQYALEERVLNSDLAQSVYLPESTLEDTYLRQRDGFDSFSDFERALRDAGLNTISYRKALHRELCIEAIMDKVGCSAEPATTADARSYFDSHPEKFSIPEKRRTRHILITLSDDNDPEEAAETLSLLTVIREQLLIEPDAFNELALRHSQCPTAVEGGQLGLVPPGVLYDSLDAVLFSLETGEISQPVRSPMGYHLLQCREIQPAEHKSFEDAKVKILAALNQQRKQKVQREWIQQLSPLKG